MILIIKLLQRFIALISAILSLFSITPKTESVELYTNPSSGYSWEYSFDNDGVLMLSSSYYSPDKSSILTNTSGGTQHFKFRAVAPGTVKITFTYVRYTVSGKNVASKYVYSYEVDKDKNITLTSVQ